MTQLQGKRSESTGRARSKAPRPTLPRKAASAGDDYGAAAAPNWRTIDWQRHAHRIDLSDGTVTYIDLPGPTGAPAAVFIHGLGGRWQNWLETLPRISQTRRVIALDLPGFGDSPMPRTDITISGYARTVTELCDALELDRFAAIGNSMGGFIACELGIYHGDRLEGIALISAAGISSTHAARSPTLTGMRLSGIIAGYAASQTRTIARRPRLRHAFMAGVVRHPTRLASDLAYEQLRGIAKPGFYPALNALLDYDFRDRLPEISCPVLLIWGREDLLVPVADADRFEHLIPNVKDKIILEDTGHVPMLERPRVVNDHLAAFLQTLTPAPADAGAAQPSRSR